MDQEQLNDAEARVSTILEVLDELPMQHAFSTLMTCISVIIHTLPEEQQIPVAEAMATALVSAVKRHFDATADPD
jgi:uncharacterized protein YejL (UPF0352 family)